MFASSSVRTANGVRAGTTTGRDSWGTLPTTPSSDVYEVWVRASTPTTTRVTTTYVAAAEDLTLALPELAPAPTIRGLGATPYVRLGATVARAGQLYALTYSYTAGASLFWTVIATDGGLEASGSDELAMPDLSMLTAEWGTQNMRLTWYLETFDSNRDIGQAWAAIHSGGRPIPRWSGV